VRVKGKATPQQHLPHGPGTRRRRQGAERDPVGKQFNGFAEGLVPLGVYRVLEVRVKDAAVRLIKVH
jgi:hypothetical protein